MTPSPLVPPPLGLVPAAGSATRLGAQPSSKEVLPIGDRPAAAYLLERLRRGGIGRALVVVRADKRDIAESLGSGERWGIELEYLEVPPTPSVPHTLDAARGRLSDRRVALGFPDILFEPVDAYRSLIERQERTAADLVLGLFPTARPEKTDMVRLDASGRPVELVIKDPGCRLELTWSIALWTPRFTAFLHRWLGEEGGRLGREPWVGDAIQAFLAREPDAPVEAVVFAQGRALDIGTPDDLALARDRYGNGPGRPSGW